MEKMTTEITAHASSSSSSSPSPYINNHKYNNMDQYIPRTTFPTVIKNNQQSQTLASRLTGDSPQKPPPLRHDTKNDNEAAIMDDSDDDIDDDDDDSDSDSNHHHRRRQDRHIRSNSNNKSNNKKANSHLTLLSTQSPAGIAAASAITPHRLAVLLIKTGPLPIRHITKHLSQQIPDFALLSLSKQRRLIMSALEMGDEETGCVFEKVGWGQWATKKIGANDVITYNNSKPQQHSSLSSSPPTIRRQSITNPHNDPHNVKVPYNPSSLDEAVIIESSSSLNSSSDEDSDNEDLATATNATATATNLNTTNGSSATAIMDDDDDEMFKLEHGGLGAGGAGAGGATAAPMMARGSGGGEVRFSSRVLNSIPQQQRRSLSSSQQRRGSSSHGIRKPKQQQQQAKSRLNSFDYYEAKYDNNSIEGVLDAAAVPDSIMFRKKPRSSFSESYLRSTPTPSLKISSEENLSLVSSSSPPFAAQDLDKMTSATAATTVGGGDTAAAVQPDTDEEDWQSIGADKLSAAYTLLMIKKED